jgi:hypothetical protein
MIDNDESKPMRHLSCDWVRDRLALLAADSDGLACPDSEVSAEDRLLVEQHLPGCSGCRARERALRNAISALTAAAVDTADGFGAPSLWPDLKERIKRQQRLPLPHGLGMLRSVYPEAIRTPAGRLLRSLTQMVTNWPLQRAWFRDSLGEQAWMHAFSRSLSPAGDKAFSGYAARAGLGFGLALAGIVLIGALALAQGWHSRAEESIAAAAAPLPVPPLPGRQELTASEDVVIHPPFRVPPRDSERLALAQSEPPAVAASMGQSAEPRRASAGPSTSPAGISASHYDFDLEHGIPMPPDTRASKPAY